MSLIGGLLAFIHEIISWFWFTFVGPSVNEPLQDTRPPREPASPNLVAQSDNELGTNIEPSGDVAAASSNGGGSRWKEQQMSETFLAQLEQRTQQVKITLANLEAERTRIEGLIAQLQPLVPHYEALLTAERIPRDADIRRYEPRVADASPVGGKVEPAESRSEAPSEATSWR
jgi:hypothetical protein